MNKIIRAFLFASCALFLFLYGMAAGHYRLFPFYQMMELRNFALFSSAKTKIARLTEAAASRPAEVLNTSLQRLLIKKVPLQINPGLSARYLTTAGNTLYIVSTHGKFQIYDLESFQKIEPEAERAPMNLDALQRSDLISMDDFSLHHFRVLGVHAEADKFDGHIVFVSHHRYEEGKGCVSFNVSRTRFQTNRQNELKQNNSWKTIYTAKPCLYPAAKESGREHFRIRLTSGGNIIPYDKDYLLVSIGDYGYDGLINESLSDDPENLFGKVILVHKTDGNHSVYAEGMRNSQGMYRDKDGTVWATDHGPQGGDELNIIQRRGHYGWPEVTYGIEYGNEPWPNSDRQGRHEGYEKPVFVWMNAVAPTKILLVENQKKFNLWSGDLIVGTLLDQSLHRLRIGEGNRILYSERIELGHRIRDMAFLPDGSLGLMTDGMVLIIIDDGGPVYEEMSPEEQIRLQNLVKYERLAEMG